MRVAAVALAIVVGFAPGASAQRISGVLSLPGVVRNAGGILVIAHDSSGTELARAVTADDGRYSLTLPRPGRITVRAERVGFDDFTILDRAVAPGEVVSIDTTTTASHRLLPTRGATPPSSCGDDQSGKEYIAILFSEARKALLAMQLGLSRPGVTGRWASTSHRIAANGRDTARYDVHRKSGSLLGAFGSPVLGELQRSGFVVSAGTDRIFRGLDIPALLSPWFEESYCFTAVETSHAMLAVQFEPVARRRDYVDIRGTLLFARTTLEITGIEYLYVGLPADEDQREAGGKITFARTPGGSWLVTEWMIRFPQIGLNELETFRSQDRGRLLQPVVLGHEFIGGMTTAVLDGRRRVWTRPEVGAYTAPVRAVCYESILGVPTGAARGRLTTGGRPVSGSRIRATWRVQVDVGGEVPLWRDETRETLSSNRGEWTLCDLPAGVTVELSWEILGRRSVAPIRVLAGELVRVDENGVIVR